MDTTDQIHSMLNLKVWAVIGATDNKEKFGFKIFKILKDAGYKVYPVNPGVDSILGDKCYPTLSALPVKPDAVNFVVPPKVGEPIIAECVALGIKNVWLQPGANGDNVVNAAKKEELNVIHKSCILVELRKQDPYL
jgi:predicted CoA-binding protein